MGNLSGTRRISFNNDFAVGPALSIEKSQDDTNILIEIDNITTEPRTDCFMRTSDVSHEDDGHAYWTQRLDELKREHQDINEIVEAEYNKTYEETVKLCEPRIITQETMDNIQPLFIYRSKIIKCYKDNPHQTLMCSALVKGFSESVANLMQD